MQQHSSHNTQHNSLYKLQPQTSSKRENTRLVQNSKMQKRAKNWLVKKIFKT